MLMKHTLVDELVGLVKSSHVAVGIFIEIFEYFGPAVWYCIAWREISHCDFENECNFHGNKHSMIFRSSLGSRASSLPMRKSIAGAK